MKVENEVFGRNEMGRKRRNLEKEIKELLEKIFSFQ